MYANLVSTDQLWAHVSDENWLLFDCRFDLADTEKGRRAFQQSHIPGAFYAHLDEHLSSPITMQTGRHPLPDMNALNRWLASCGMQSKRQVVVYDDSGGAMAVRLWWLLKCLGHQKVAVLDGGWPAWVSKGYSTTAENPQAEMTPYQAAFNAHYTVSTHEVEKNVHEALFKLVDVRSAERFQGIAEPIDTVAGHIPGAINIPLTQNLDDEGFFKPVPQLKELYAPVMDQYPVEKQVYMCGSGVTACHSVFALSLAGLGFPRLYAGSWSEWIRDPDRPVATTQSDLME
jgi:thiosulfate/3-mercaptopyruvate sulfurtransferase